MYSGNLRHVDQELLLLKAASQAMLMSLSQCLLILQQQASTSCDCHGRTTPHCCSKNHSALSAKSSGDTPSCSSHSKKKYVLQLG